MLFISFDLLGMHSTSTIGKTGEDKKSMQDQILREMLMYSGSSLWNSRRATDFLLGKVTNTLSIG